MKTQFIGRHVELKQIRDLREQGPSRVLISVFGEGGIGKTSVVTQAVREVEALERADRVAALVDFDLPHNRALPAVREAIADALGGAGFKEYWAELRDFDEREAGGASLFARDRARQRVENAFRQALGQALEGRRLLLVFDTIERVQDSVMFDELLDLLRLLDNVVVLIAGRRNEQIEPQLQRVYEHFYPLPAEPLDSGQSKEHLSTVLAGESDEQTLAKLCLLAGGRPILLDLAATWLDRQRRQWHFLNETDRRYESRLLQLPFEDLQANLDEYRARFELEVVDGVRALSSPLDWAVLYMALLEHPCSAELWEYMLGLDQSTAEQLMEDLNTLFFVRADFTLHDEMRELVLRHVWPYVDPQGSMRRKTLERLLDFTLANKAEEPGWMRWFQEAEELHYRLALDVEKGYRHFVTEFNRARDHRWLSECQLLAQTIRRPQHWSRLATEMQLDVRVYEAQLYTFIGQEARMERECQEILDDPQTPDAVKVEALCNIAYGLRDYRPQASVANYERALELDRKSGDEVGVARILNLTGQVYRRLVNMGKAIQYFEESIRLSDKHEAWAQKASAQNNLAYVYRQLGDIDTAMNLARMAFVIRERLGNQLGLAYSYQTIGEIYRDRNDLTTAEERFVIAREIFSHLGAEDDVARVDVLLANLCRKRHEPAEVERYLSESLAIFERMRNDEGRAQALNEYGCELRKRGRESSRALKDAIKAGKEFQKAKEYFVESVDISRRMENWYRAADNLADLCLLYRYWFENCSEDDEDTRRKLIVAAQDVAYEAIAIARGHRFLLPESRAIESLGDLYYARGKYTKAFAQFYIQACLDMAEHYGTSLWRYNRVFDRVHRRILSPNIPDEEVRFIATYMVRRWREEGKEAIAPGFVKVYEGIARDWGVGAIR